MPRRIFVLLALAAAPLTGPSLLAAEPALTPANLAAAQPETTFSVYEENDSHWLKPNNATDRHYTQGLEIAVGLQPQWAKDLAAAIPGAAPDPRAAFTFVAGQLMFTPQDIAAVTPDPTDHPYAGYLFFGGLLQRRDAAGTSLDEFQLDLGVVGPSSLAEDTQIWFHKHIADAQHPNGWASQVKDEGTIQFTFRKKWDIALLKPAAQDSSALGVDLIPYAGFALGTVRRNLEGGGTLRVGWNLPDDFGPGRLADPTDATAIRANHGGWGVYGFTRLAGRIVEHDTFIGGSDFRSGPGVTERPIVGEIQAGLSAAYRGDGWSLEVTYSQTFMTKEFVPQHGTDGFGAVAAHLTLLF